MTREEAIKELKEDKMLYETDLCHAGDGSPDGRLLEALDMAIEALSVANLKEEFESAVPNCQKCAIKELWKATEKEDLVSVVRCKDCRHCSEYYDRDGYPYWICDEWDGGTDADGFCSYGEKREEVNGFKSVGQAWNTSQERR